MGNGGVVVLFESVVVVVKWDCYSGGILKCCYRIRYEIDVVFECSCNGDVVVVFSSVVEFVLGIERCVFVFGLVLVVSEDVGYF